LSVNTEIAAMKIGVRAALRAVLEDADPRKRFAIAALVRAQRFSRQRAARDIQNVYEDVISERRRTA
jgi:hypothetical protein